MISSVSEYLALLKTELSGSDPATIQDAMADAEEYLRDALQNAPAGQPESEALASSIEAFGSPAEFAAAYKKIEAHVQPALAAPPTRPGTERSPLVRFFAVLADPAAWGALVYLLLSLVTGILYFTWGVTGLSLSAGLIVLIIGLPFMALFLLSVRGIALVEGRIVEALLGVRMPRRPLFVDRNLSMWERFKVLFASRHTWFSLLYMLLMLPLGVLYFSVFITLLTLALSLIAAPVVQLFFGFPLVSIGDTRYYLSLPWLPVFVLAGLLVAILTMHLARLTGRMQASIARAMLVS
jgi:uncharacterized membrane protein